MFGVAFAAVGLALCALVAYATHALRVYGPTIREFLLWMVVPQYALGMLTMLVLVALFALAMCWKSPV